MGKGNPCSFSFSRGKKSPLRKFCMKPRFKYECPGIFLGHTDYDSFRYDAYYRTGHLIMVDAGGSDVLASLKSIKKSRRPHTAWKKALELYEGLFEDPSISPDATKCDGLESVTIYETEI